MEEHTISIHNYIIHAQKLTEKTSCGGCVRLSVHMHISNKVKRKLCNSKQPLVYSHHGLARVFISTKFCIGSVIVKQSPAQEFHVTQTSSPGQCVCVPCFLNSREYVSMLTRRKGSRVAWRFHYLITDLHCYFIGKLCFFIITNRIHSCLWRLGVGVYGHVSVNFIKS